MNYVYCPAYGALYFALHMLNKGDSVTVITANESIKRYCGFAEIRCVSLSHYEIANFPSLLSGFHQLVARRRYLDRCLKSLDVRKEDRFYAVGAHAGYSGYYLAKQWAKRGRAYVTTEFDSVESWPIDVHISPHLERYVRRLKRAQMIVRLVLGLRLKIFDVKAAKLTLGIDDEFLRDHGITRIPLGFPEGLRMEAIEKSVIEIGRFDNLMAAGYPAILGVATANSLAELYRRISAFSSEVVVKPHPVVTGYEKRQDDVADFFKGFRLLPPFIPVELLFNNVNRNVLSVQSTALISAARMQHLNAISLMNLVEYKEHRMPWADVHRKMLREQSGDRIIFVRDFEELERLLLT